MPDGWRCLRARCRLHRRRASRRVQRAHRQCPAPRSAGLGRVFGGHGHQAQCCNANLGFAQFGGIAHAAVHHNACPAIALGGSCQIAAHQRPAHRAAAVHHQHPALAGVSSSCLTRLLSSKHFTVTTLPANCGRPPKCPNSGAVRERLRCRRVCAHRTDRRSGKQCSLVLLHACCDGLLGAACSH